MTSKPKAYGADLVIPVLALAFTLYFLDSISELEWEAKANGLFVGWAIIALIGVQLVRVIVGFARGQGTFSFSTLLEPHEALPKRLGMLAITIVFVAAVPWLGLGLGLFIALAAALAVMGVRGWKHVLLVAFITAGAATLLFNGVLDTGLPKGPVEKLVERLVR